MKAEETPPKIRYFTPASSEASWVRWKLLSTKKVTVISSKLTKSSTKSLADAAKSIPTKAKTVRAKNSESPAPNLGA